LRCTGKRQVCCGIHAKDRSVLWCTGKSDTARGRNVLRCSGNRDRARDRSVLWCTEKIE